MTCGTMHRMTLSFDLLTIILSYYGAIHLPTYMELQKVKWRPERAACEQLICRSQGLVAPGHKPRVLGTMIF